MSHEGAPGFPGKRGEPGTRGGGRGGTGGAGGRGGAGDTAISRRGRYALAFLFCFALTLAAANVLFTSRQVDSVRAVQVTATRNTASIIQLCQAGNEFRAQQVVLWEHLVAISKPPPRETVQARTARIRTARSFLAYIHQVFAPRRCASLGR